MAIAQPRSKRDYDLQVRVTNTFWPGGWVFINRLPLAATLVTNASRTALSTYNKLMPQRLGLFRVKTICLHLRQSFLKSINAKTVLNNLKATPSILALKS